MKSKEKLPYPSHLSIFPHNFAPKDKTNIFSDHAKSPNASNSN